MGKNTVLRGSARRCGVTFGPGRKTSSLSSTRPGRSSAGQEGIATGTTATMGSDRPLAALRNEFGPLRSYVKEFVDKISETALPLILVYCFSCLEGFLRRAY